MGRCWTYTPYRTMTSKNAKVSVFILNAVLLLAGSPVYADHAPSIAGPWVLDVKLSDKAPRIIRRGPEGEGYGDNDEARRWRRHGSEGEAAVNGPRTSEAARGFQEIFSATRLYITEQPPEVDVLYDGHRLRQIFTDGRGSVATASGSVRPELGPSIASWYKGALVVDTTPQPDTHVVEHFKPSADGRTLTITTRIDHIGMKKPYTFKRVFYNPDKPPPAPQSSKAHSGKATTP